jgi:hypothetical protein
MNPTIRDLNCGRQRLMLHLQALLQKNWSLQLLWEIGPAWRLSLLIQKILLPLFASEWFELKN